MAFNGQGRYGLQAPPQFGRQAPPVDPLQPPIMMQGLQFPQQGLFAPGQKPQSNVKLPLIREGMLGDTQTAPQGGEWTSGYDTPNQDMGHPAQQPQQVTPQAAGEDKFMQLMNNPMFQFGINLLGSSTGPNPWGGALQSTLAAQLSSAQAKRQAALANVEQQRANQDYELGKGKLGVEQQTANQTGAYQQGELGQSQQRNDLGRATLEQNAPLVPAQVANLNSEMGYRTQQGQLDAQKIQQMSRQMDMQQQFMPQLQQALGGGLFSGDQPQNGATQVPQGDVGRHGTPGFILNGLSRTESSGNPNAQGPLLPDGTRAQGEFQFRPSTVAMLAKQGYSFDPKDPQQARDAADFYLSQLAQKHGGDYRAALADYGGFVTKDPTAYINKVVGNQPLPAANVGPASQVPGGVQSGDRGLNVAKAGALGAMAGIPGAQNLVEVGKMMQPQSMPAGGYQRDPATGKTDFLPDPYKEQSANVEKARLGLEQTKTSADVAHTEQNTKEAAAKQSKEQATDTNNLQDTTAQLDRLAQSAKALSAHPGLDSMSGVSGMLGLNKATQNGRDAAAQVDKLKSELMINTMAALRASSQSGSTGMGQLNQAEGDTLRNVIANLDTKSGQSLKQLQSQLNDVQQFAEGAKTRLQQKHASLYNQSGSPNVAPSIGAQSSQPAQGAKAPAGGFKVLGME